MYNFFGDFFQDFICRDPVGNSWNMEAGRNCCFYFPAYFDNDALKEFPCLTSLFRAKLSTILKTKN